MQSNTHTHKIENNFQLSKLLRPKWPIPFIKNYENPLMMVSTQFPPKKQIPPKKGFNIPLKNKLIKKK